jgi:hypothetical protein
VAPLVIQEEIFEHLAMFWAAAQTPTQWQKVQLILIQKDPAKPAVMGRPIGLIEVLRKIQTKTVIARIHPLLKKHKVLQRNQFVFLPGRGTHSELIQLINVLEEIAENDLPVDLTTADVKGAVDSPERIAQYAAWRRAGIPAPLAIYLVNLGVCSTYRLASPYGLRQNLDPLAAGVDRPRITPGCPLGEGPKVTLSARWDGLSSLTSCSPP